MSFWQGWLWPKWIELWGALVKLKTTGFTGNLDGSVTDVQLLANAVDALPLGEVNVPQVNTDWNATGTVAELLNKPVDISEFTDITNLLVETDPVFAAWLTAWAYFANTIILDNSNFGSGNLTAECVTAQDLADEVDALTLGADKIAITPVTTIPANRFVNFNAALCGYNQKSLGVTIAEITGATTGNIQFSGIVSIEVGEEITKGDSITAGAAGKAICATIDSAINGYAITSGATGTILVLLA